MAVSSYIRVESIEIKSILKVHDRVPIHQVTSAFYEMVFWTIQNLKEIKKDQIPSLM